MKRVRNTAWALLPLLASVAAASPPMPSDIALDIRVLPNYPEFRPPGTSGVLELTIENRYPQAYRFMIHTGQTMLPTGEHQPIRLTAPPDGIDSNCDIEEFTDPKGDGSEFSYSFWGHLQIDQTVTCRMDFHVLPSATHPWRLTFRATAVSLGSAGYYDLTPENNIAHFHFGGAGLPEPRPVPMGGGLTLLLTLLLSLTALRRLGRNATS